MASSLRSLRSLWLRIPDGGTHKIAQNTEKSQPLADPRSTPRPDRPFTPYSQGSNSNSVQQNTYKDGECPADHVKTPVERSEKCPRLRNVRNDADSGLPIRAHSRNPRSASPSKATCRCLRGWQAAFRYPGRNPSRGLPSLRQAPAPPRSRPRPPRES